MFLHHTQTPPSHPQGSTLHYTTLGYTRMSSPVTLTDHLVLASASFLPSSSSICRRNHWLLEEIWDHVPCWGTLTLVKVITPLCHIPPIFALESAQEHTLSGIFFFHMLLWICLVISGPHISWQSTLLLTLNSVRGSDVWNQALVRHRQSTGMI